MKKITTLFKKNPDNLSLVIDEINPENQWVFYGEVIATRKFDGTAAAIIDKVLYKRYDVKKGKKVPEGAIACQEPDEITGHWPHWVKVDFSKPEDKYFVEAFFILRRLGMVLHDATYELCGPKINKNREHLTEHHLIQHGKHIIPYSDLFNPNISFNSIKNFLKITDIEGIVFYNYDGRMCKIRKSDFGIKR